MVSRAGLAGVNPVYGLYGYLVGTFTGALVTSSSFMAVQATGAMAIVIADVGTIRNADDPARALFTLSFTTGVLMILPACSASARSCGSCPTRRSPS